MTENESFTIEELEQCSYRYLQSVAKNLKLPCNVKKLHLINMIFAKKYRSEAELELIIKQVRQERLLNAQAKVKQTAKVPKSSLQGKEISSTNPQSPTPQILIRCPPISTTLVKYNGNETPIQENSQCRRSDRLLRSLNRQNNNYKYMFNNTLVGLVKSQSIIKKTQKVAANKKTDATVKYLLNHFKTNPNGSNSLIQKNFRELTIQKCVPNKPQTTPIVVQPNKRQRTVSGIYPLNPPTNPPTNQPSSHYINIRGKDGKLTKINALIQCKNYSVQKYETNQNICVSIQDIINSKVTEQKEKKYILANTEQVRNKDYPNMFSVKETVAMESKSSVKNVKISQSNKKDTEHNDTEKNTNQNSSILIYSHKPIENEIVSHQVPTEPQHYIRNNQFGQNQMESPSPVSCTTRQNDQKARTISETITNKKPEMSKPDTIPIATPEVIRNRPVFTIYTKDTQPIVARTEMPAKYNAMQQYQTEYSSQNQYNMPNYVQNQDYIQNQQNYSTYNTNQWVYNQNNFLNPTYTMDSTGEFYYHKKIRATRGLNHRENEDINDESLPRINKVFSRFNYMEKDVTKPLYVQVSKESERIYNYPLLMANNHSTHLLESFYNFKNCFITNEPLLQMVTTTSQTQCTYTTPLITTPIAQPSTVPTDLYQSPEPADPPVYTPTERPCLLDLFRAAEHDTLQEEFRTRGETSPSSLDSSSPANVTIPEMVDDAMEIISQDGDYMDRINSDVMDDVRTECCNCEWSGPRDILDYHLRQEHGIHPESSLLHALRHDGCRNYSAQWAQTDYEN